MGPSSGILTFKGFGSLWLYALPKVGTPRGAKLWSLSVLPFVCTDSRLDCLRVDRFFCAACTSEVGAGMGEEEGSEPTGTQASSALPSPVRIDFSMRESSTTALTWNGKSTSSMMQMGQQQHHGGLMILNCSSNRHWTYGQTTYPPSSEPGASRHK